jgi:hypothetical protein
MRPPRGTGEEAAGARRNPVPVSEESHREEMNAAIRAQRERGAVPRSMLPPEDAPPPPPAAPEPPPSAPEPGPPPPEPEPGKRGFLSRLLRRP